MPKNSFADWDTTAANNTDIASVNIDEGCAPSGMNNAVRAVMAQLKSGVPGLASTNTFTGENTFTKTQIWAKGADVASAASLPIIDDGNYFDVTGTTTVTSIATVGVGAVIKLHFDGVLILTHHSTDLVLPGAANITTAAGDEAEFVEYAAGDWRCTNYQRASVAPSVGGIVKEANYQTIAFQTGTTTVPLDDTIPQNTEGNEFMTAAFTPTNASNRLEIDVVAMVCHSADTAVLIGSLYQDTTANALASGTTQVVNSSGVTPLVFRYTMVAGTTSATTFKVRVGSPTGGTTSFNGVSGGRLLGGNLVSSITIKELRA